MKNLSKIVAVVLLLSLLTPFALAADTRFQIVDHKEKSSVWNTISEAILLDTETGQTWVFTKSGWQPMSMLPSEADIAAHQAKLKVARAKEQVQLEAQRKIEIEQAMIAQEKARREQAIVEAIAAKADAAVQASELAKAKAEAVVAAEIAVKAALELAKAKEEIAQSRQGIKIVEMKKQVKKAPVKTVKKPVKKKVKRVYRPVRKAKPVVKKPAPPKPLVNQPPGWLKVVEIDKYNNNNAASNDRFMENNKPGWLAE